MQQGCSDAILCFGDVVTLDHSTGLRLACDIWDEIMPGKGVFSTSAVAPGARSTTGPHPTARSAFVIVPSNGMAGTSPADPMRVTYGQPFRLQSLLVADEESVSAGLLEPRPTCYLASAAKTDRMASRLTNRQMVFALGGATPETLWTFERAVYTQGPEAAEDKYFSKNQPVQVCFPLMRYPCAQVRPIKFNYQLLCSNTPF